MVKMRPPTFLGAIATASLLLTTFTHALPQLSEESAPISKRVPSFGRVLSQTSDSDIKYFHEPGGNDVLGHYDIRYYKGKPVSYEEKQNTLQHLIRSYLTIFRELNIETWIAHGTLLGWWWNGKIMPWDYDLDTQVSTATLNWLAVNMNMTMHNYTGRGEDGSTITREYLLDVNPNYVDRTRGNGWNVIDARWIDVRNGLFIDITGLEEVSPSTQPGMWRCKNQHRYRTRQLYPLRETEFEGVPALVPYAFDKILTIEYSPRAMTKTLHQGHRWNPEQKEWVPEPRINIHGDGEGNSQDQNQNQDQDQQQNQNQNEDQNHNKSQDQNQGQDQSQGQNKEQKQEQKQEQNQQQQQEAQQEKEAAQEKRQDHPHMPRSIQGDEKRKAGLGNLLRVL